MLAIEIASGIVLAILFLNYLRQIVTAATWAAGVVVLVAGGFAAIEAFSNNPALAQKALQLAGACAAIIVLRAAQAVFENADFKWNGWRFRIEWRAVKQD